MSLATQNSSTSPNKTRIPLFSRIETTTLQPLLTLATKHTSAQLLGLLPSSIPCWVLSNHRASKMKNKASTFLKEAFSFLVTMVKAKSMVAKSKRSAIKARLLIFGLLRNRKVLMSAISHKMHALIGQEKREDTQNEEENSKAIVLYNNAVEAPRNTSHLEPLELDKEEDEEDDYPDLRHSLFNLDDDDDDDDDDDELANGTGSVIDFVRNSREDGTKFSLEDEIDHVADVFIRRFHRQMKIQKQESFKRYREMLARGV